MKKTILIGFIGLLGLVGPIRAQEVAVDSLPALEPLRIFTELEPEVTVHQSGSVERLITSRVQGVEREVTTVKKGYRIQFYSSNDAKRAANESAKVAEQLRKLNLGYDIYRTYQAPFWRVRVGNFETQEEANEVMDELLEIVRKQAPKLLENGGVYSTHDEVEIN